MDKPRICEVLGIEVDEKFTYDLGENQVNRGTFKIGADGKRYYKGETDTWYPCYNEEDLLVIINRPDRIIRKPRFTKQEVEDAKTIKRMFGAATFTHIHNDEDGWPEMMDGPGEDGNVGWCSIGMEEGMFPSLRPNETVTLDEIIGGTQ